jgi:ribonuclease-3
MTATVDRLAELEHRMGVTFQNRSLLELALTHPSAVRPDAFRQHNQRLEFLGDAVLQLILTADLFRRHSEEGEGTLTKARSRLANRQFLARKAKGLDLGRHLVLSRGEETGGGRRRPSILSDALEAVIGAIYLDQGFGVAEEMVLNLVADDLAGLTLEPDAENPKGQLQEALQASGEEPPAYRVEEATGPDHQRMFRCSVHHLGRQLGEGEGPSKKAAESAAARAALTHLQGN